MVNSNNNLQQHWIVPQEQQEQQIEINQENAQIVDEQQEEFSDGNMQVDVANNQEQEQHGYYWQLQGIDREIFLGQNDGNAIGAQQQQHQQPVIHIKLHIIQGYIPIVRAIADINNRIQTDADAVRYMRMIGMLQPRFICKNNHSVNFVDPNTEAHTQTIEGTWAHLRRMLPPFGAGRHLLSIYLLEFLFRRRTGRDITLFHQELGRLNNRRFQEIEADWGELIDEEREIIRHEEQNSDTNEENEELQANAHDQQQRNQPEQLLRNLANLLGVRQLFPENHQINDQFVGAPAQQYGITLKNGAEKRGQKEKVESMAKASQKKEGREKKEGRGKKKGNH
ncbi:MAG: hypothetical protein EZS28_027081 [Streblomastix strix]|uniref:Uncharacterized protein n=1 Tax=Streblomastix strix TaxID=222440 RepID=A0A5J4V4T2_9EUKA|nr:MAG: hypothetical protein EZS28_027081 [Streblomastix strix]